MILTSIVTILLLLPSTSATDTSTSGQLFGPQKLCPGKVLSVDRCPIAQTLTDRTLAECSLLCGTRAACQGFLLDSATDVCHLCDELVDGNCTNTQPAGSLVSFEKWKGCDDNGVVTPYINRCDCLQGVLGQRCEKRMTDCDDYGIQGYPNGQYWILPDLTKPAMFVRCEMTWKRTYVMKRASSTFDFYRGWNDYVNGFGSVASTDFWLGLESLSILTQSRCYLLNLEVILSNGSYFQFAFKQAVLSSSSSNYTLSFTNQFAFNPVSHNLGDCLSAVKGQPFSTYDADHDGDVNQNCAVRHHSGWWFGSGGNCTLCNPTGRLLKPAGSLRTWVDDEVFFTPLDKGNLSPHKVESWLQRASGC